MKFASLLFFVCFVSVIARAEEKFEDYLKFRKLCTEAVDFHKKIAESDGRSYSTKNFNEGLKLAESLPVYPDNIHELQQKALKEITTAQQYALYVNATYACAFSYSRIGDSLISSYKEETVKAKNKEKIRDILFVKENFKRQPVAYINAMMYLHKLKDAAKKKIINLSEQDSQKVSLALETLKAQSKASQEKVKKDLPDFGNKTKDTDFTPEEIKKITQIQATELAEVEATMKEVNALSL